MGRGPLYEEGYQPQLSGHETFPLRYGWLKKAFDAVRKTEDEENYRSVFFSDDAIARFGVGKNMVASMRHWAISSGIIKEDPVERRVRCTEFGCMLFGDGSLDPYMENLATSWHIHWRLCGRDEKTTWFWAFNHFPALLFEREALIRGVSKLADERGWRRSSIATIRRDVSCFVRTYVPQPVSRHTSYEDALESPLTELGLIKATGRRDGFRFVRGPKPSLGDGVFSYAVVDFWSRYSNNSNTLSFEALSHEPGSPGRVFLLDENDLVDHLGKMETVTEGNYRWSETAGLKQLIRRRDLTTEETNNVMAADYIGSYRQEEFA